MGKFKKIGIGIGILTLTILIVILLIFTFNESTTKLNIITDKISLVNQKEDEQFVQYQYRNNAYTCAKEGFHIFSIQTKKEIMPSDPRPLVVFLSGGGMGTFLPDGNYKPEAYYPGKLHEATAIIPFFKGQMDDVGIYDFELTSSQVTSLYDSFAAATVSQYQFENNLNDSIGTNTGTLNSGGIEAYTAGIVGQAFDFDGSTHIVTNDDSFDFERTDAFSFSIWFKTDIAGVNDYLVSKMPSDAGYQLLLKGTDNQVRVRISNAGDNMIIVDTLDANVRDGNWHHVTMTYDGSSSASGVSIYIDGVSLPLIIGADGLDQSIQNDGSLIIGNQKITGPVQWASKNDGLKKYFRDHPSEFRFLFVKQCDHDAYSGIGTIDINNPNNPDELGEERKVDGLLALRSALEFTKNEMSTTHVFVYGISSGGVGAMSLATSLGDEGKHLSGIILDSSIFYPYGTQLIEAGCTDRRFDGYDFQIVLDRVGYFFEEENQPHSAIIDGRVKSPIFNVWNSDDWGWNCGNTVVTVKKGDEIKKGSGSYLTHHLLDEAIDEYNPGGNSQWRELCVDDPRRTPSSSCSYHGPTQINYLVYGGDKYRDGEDYNKIIIDWVTQIINDTS